MTFRAFVRIFPMLALLVVAIGLAQGEPPASEDPAVAAEIEATAQRDAEIERTLLARFARAQALRDVRVEVEAGLVALAGTVDDEARKEQAGRVAEGVEGVVAVDNRIEIATALDRRLAPVLENGLARLKRLVMAAPLLAIALIIVYLFHLLGSWLTKFDRPFRRFKRNPYLGELLRQVLRLALLLAGVLIALDLLGATALVGAVLGAAGVAGLALGFAFKDLIENYIAGVLLSLRQPFAPNDHVVIDGHEGRVAALTARSTTLITLDGNHLRLPNALVFKGVILNYTRNPTRRFAFDVTLGKDGDVAAAQSRAVEALRTAPGVVAEPPPDCRVQALTPAGVTLRCLAWVDQRTTSFGKAQSEATRAVNDALSRPAPKAAQPPATAPVPSPAAMPPAPAGPADVARETHVDRQVEEERLAQSDKDLLRADAPKE